MKKTSVFMTATLVVAMAQMAVAADVTGKVTLKGTAPAEKEITPLKDDPNCGKLHSTVPTTHFYTVSGKGELADVVVSIEGVGGGSSGASASPVVIDQKGCEYGPQILAVQTDQKIQVKNSDPVLHNVHTVPTVAGNAEKNQAQAPGASELTFAFSKPENFLKFKCDVHPWMFAWVSVFDHPYFAVTGPDGSFKIANVKPGKYKITAAHRKAGTVTQEIEVKDGGATANLTLEAK
jgi:plastocyanin